VLVQSSIMMRTNSFVIAFRCSNGSAKVSNSSFK
jgi:hypothetical protein